jgi:hypothetical protein
VFLEEVEAGLRNGSIDETVRRLIGPKTALESVRLGDTLAGLVHDSLALRDYYAIPLDIEFVVTGEGGYGFVQFRPLFRL